MMKEISSRTERFGALNGSCSGGTMVSLVDAVFFVSKNPRMWRGAGGVCTGIFPKGHQSHNHYMIVQLPAAHQRCGFF